MLGFWLDQIAYFYGGLWVRRRRLRQRYFFLYYIILYVVPAGLVLGIFVLGEGWNLMCLLMLLPYAPLRFARYFAEKRNYFADKRNYFDDF